MEAQNDRQFGFAAPRLAPAVMRIVLPYALFASLWILLSDRALEGLVADPATRVRWSIFKGWAFVAVTATLLAIMLRRELARLAGAQTAMRESEERFRAMATTITDGVVLMAPQRQIYFFNAAAEKMFACAAADVCGKELRQILGAPQPALAAAMDELMAASQRDLTGKIIEISAQRRGGEEFPLEISLSPMRLREATHIVGILRDITERKRLEGQLRQALKMESVGQLAGGVAHDFNNILSVLMMQISLLKRDRLLPPALFEPLEEMEREVKRAANLTRQLLLYSRRQVMQTQVLDLNALVDNLLKMLGRLLGEQIQISFERWARPAWVEADSGMLEQVVMNLCVNARDAMPKGGALRLGLAVREIDPGQAQANIEARPGAFACLSVADSGCGMDEATLQRIFDPFFTTKEVGKGTGLGLATVYGIVKQHQGWVEVESRVGEGTAFVVYLPATTPAEPSPASPGLPSETVAGGSETLLLVEDDPQVRRAISLFLRGQGYRVIEAGNGVEALRLWNLHESAINLLLTDMVMPEGMTGLELAEQLRGRKPGLKVIISSGYSSELLGPGGKLVANVLYLPKPCEATLLAKTVRECLDSSADS